MPNKGKRAQSSDVAEAKESAPRSRRPARIVGGLLAVLLTIAVVVFFLGEQGSVARLAQLVPEGTAVFVEVPSVSHALASLSTSKVMNASAVDPKETAESAASAITAAFRVSHDEAAALVRGSVSAAYVARPDGKELKSAWLVSLDSARATRALASVFDSNRVTADGVFGKDGKGYRLTAGPSAKNVSLFEKSLRELSTVGSGQKLVWFPGRRVLALGDAGLLHDIAGVIDASKPSLEQSDAYKAAAARRGQGADGVLFVDERAIHGLALTGPLAYLNGLGARARDEAPLVASLRLGPAGVLVSGSAVLAESSPAPPFDMAAPPKLSLPARLPSDTLLYVAGATKRTGSPAEAKTWFTSKLTGTQVVPGHDVVTDLHDIEQSTGIALEDLFEMAGDEAALAVVLAKDFKFSLSTPIVAAALDGVGVVFVEKVDGDAAARRVLAKIREAVERSDLAKLGTITRDGDGFLMVPSSEAGMKMGRLLGAHLPIVRVKYARKELFVAVARPEIVDHALEAFDNGTATLKHNAAHALAMTALRPDARGYAWLDVGRLASFAYAGNPAARDDAKARGLPVDSMNLTGDARVTAALALDLRALPNEKSWSLELDSLNLWALSLVTGWQAGSAHGHTDPAATPSAAPAAPSGEPTTPPPGTGEMATLAEMSHCADAVDTLEHCASKADASDVRADYLKRAAEERTKLTQVPKERAALADKSCLLALDKLRRTPACQ